MPAGGGRVLEGAVVACSVERIKSEKLNSIIFAETLHGHGGEQMFILTLLRGCCTQKL